MSVSIEDFLDKAIWVIDFLPWRVPDGSAGSFFAVERYFLEPPRLRPLYRRFGHLLLKLNCYFDLQVAFEGDETWIQNPDPALLVQGVLKTVKNRRPLWALLPGPRCLIEVRGDDLYLSVYDPNAELQRLLRILAEAEGLFFWKAQEPSAAALRATPLKDGE